MEREALNFPIQGGAAEVMLACLAGLQGFLESAELAAQRDRKASCPGGALSDSYFYD